MIQVAPNVKVKPQLPRYNTLVLNPERAFVRIKTAQPLATRPVPRAETRRKVMRNRAMPCAGNVVKKATPTIPIGQHNPCKMPIMALVKLAPLKFVDWLPPSAASNASVACRAQRQPSLAALWSPAPYQLPAVAERSSPEFAPRHPTSSRLLKRSTRCHNSGHLSLGHTLPRTKNKREAGFAFSLPRRATEAAWRCNGGVGERLGVLVAVFVGAVVASCAVNAQARSEAAIGILLQVLVFTQDEVRTA
eukprot:CAMPEP_0115382490 /NCGR_PEP_ID=MMETSP0271-20121206/6109_1 /TAXON_ID=71861 /ORGANISM="Scrippsiella trochoidea, Strain CCMP3099" /LENGTH=247 /DNA_ID=CAMNT_0002805795 /DNA_START=108 /DNA_END=854 /DNA_ORIENTATION=-